jgi:hypothetical protein
MVAMRLLAGPLVRRVEPRLASFWVATDVPCDIDLDIWTEIQRVPAPSPSDYHAKASTLRVGDKLHIGLVVADLTTAAQPLVPERLYSYNLAFSPKDGSPAQTLQTLGLLRDRPPPKPHLALGYGTDVLPGFVLPPRQLKDLRILHGSCRRIGFDGPDAMMWIDDLIRDNRTDAILRPHQLFLTGDQIYADNLPTPLQHVLTNTGNELLGSVEQLPTQFSLAANPPGITLLPCDTATFPAGLRKNLIMHDARMSTSDGANHLLGFGEFCAMHLFVWCNEYWPDALPDNDAIFPVPAALPPPIWALHLGLLGPGPPKALKEDVRDPSRKPDEKKSLILRDLPFTLDNAKTVLDAFKKRIKSEDDDSKAKGGKTEIEVTQDFLAGLPRVRRALANIATYMIFDDHELTDDWNFSQIWKDRVFTSPLGRTVLRNGLAAYTLFQGWGNDPKQFTEDIRAADGTVKPSPQKRLLDRITALFPSGVTLPPAKDPADEIDQLLGLGGTTPTPTAAPPPQVTWHYTVPGERYLVLVLDVRTRRGYTGRIAPPQNLTADALKLQIPTTDPTSPFNLPQNIDVVLVVSSLTVMGPPVFDILFGPLVYRFFDFKDFGDRVTMPGTNPDAIESWINDEVAFERLMKALQPLKRVVLLSGDVHYATSVAMSYWKDRTEPPARIAQFTSSAFRNDFFAALAEADQNFAIMQKALQLDVDAARLGWNEKIDDLLAIPAGRHPPPALDRRLQESPVLLVPRGWPDGTNEKVVHRPDWAWRIEVIRDRRTDADRPAAARAAPLLPATPQQDVKENLDAYPHVAARQVKQLDNMNHTRQMLFATNFGAIHFEHTQVKVLGQPQDVIVAVHELYAVHPEAPLPDKPEVYMRHRIPLDAPLAVSDRPVPPPDPAAPPPDPTKDPLPGFPPYIGTPQN